MAMTIYGEARGESKMGKVMVMDVINNRKISSKYPNNICGVIKQRKQFSFWNGSYSKNFESIKASIPKDRKIYKNIVKLVELYLTGAWGFGEKGISRGSMWYHADYIRPKWSNNLNRVYHIGSHIFYRNKYKSE
jgi:spore germination cell wall hydrolase CwlJ-like protein